MNLIEKLDLLGESPAISSEDLLIQEKINELIDAVNQVREPKKNPYSDIIDEIYNKALRKEIGNLKTNSVLEMIKESIGINFFYNPSQNKLLIKDIFDVKKPISGRGIYLNKELATELVEKLADLVVMIKD